MATKLFLKNTLANGIIIASTNVYDMDITAPSSADTSVTNTTASGTEIQLTKTAGGNVIQWVSGRVPSGGFTLTSTDISINALESNMSANVGGRYRVYKFAGATGVITELGGGPFDDGVEWGTTVAVFTWTGNVTDTAFSEDDRVLLRIFLTNVGTMAAGFTGTLQFNGASGGTSDCFLNLAETVTFKTDQRRYWVGGTANWDATVGTRWSAWTGGTGGSPIPTSTDDTYLDANSGAVTVTVASGNTGCADLDCTAFTGTLAGSAAITCSGSFKLVSGMTFTNTSAWTFGATSSVTITMGTKALGGNADFNGVGGTFTLQDAFSIGASTLNLTNGTLDSNGQTVGAAAFVSSNSNTRALTMGSSVWTLSGVGTVWSLATTTGMTLNAGTSEIKFTAAGGGDATFSGGGLTYAKFTNDTSSTSKVDVVGSNTFSTFDIAKTNNSRTVRFTAGTTTTVTSFTKSAGTTHTLTSITSAQHFLVDTSGTNSISNTTLSFSNASGGASWEAFVSNTNVDGGDNTGWNFGPGGEPLMGQTAD